MCEDMWSVQSVFYLILLEENSVRVDLDMSSDMHFTFGHERDVFFFEGFQSHRGTQGYPKLIQILTGVSITKHPFGPCVNYNDLDRAVEMLVSTGDYPLK